MEGYRYLVTFQLCEVIYALTLRFLEKYLRGFDNRRLREQMEHAIRSSKQCIAEGYSQGTSLKGYIKMLGVSKGSLEELKLDYIDFLKRRKLEIWEVNHPRIREFRVFRVRILGKKGNEFIHNTPNLPNTPHESANLVITLISMTNFLLDKQIKSLEEKHKREGGFTEKLYKSRIDFRKSPQYPQKS